MAAGLKLKVTIKRLQYLDNASRRVKQAFAQALEDIATEGAMVFAEAARAYAPVKTGTLARSIGWYTTKRTGTFAMVTVRPSVRAEAPYARRVEEGFAEADSLGRIYHQGPQPYMRPAYDSHKDRARAAMLAAAENAVHVNLAGSTLSGRRR